MAISIRDIAAADSYQGNAGLGAPLDNAIKIDIRPLENLAQYTFLYNQEKRRQEEKQAQARLKEIAEMSAIDWQNAIPKERDIAIKAMTDFNEYAKTIATKDLKDPKINIEYQAKKNEALKKIKSINSRFTSYGLRLKEIADATSEEEKARLRKNLDEDVAKTTILDPLPLTQKYNVKPVEVPETPIMDIKIAQSLANNNDEIKNANIPDMTRVDNLAFGVAYGLKSEMDKSSPEALRAMSASGKTKYFDMAETYTAAINDPLYKNADGSFNPDKFLSSSSPASGVAKQIEFINAEMAEYRRRADLGEFGNQLSSADFPDMNWRDGISPEELAKIEILAKRPKKVREQDRIFTGATLKADDNQRQWYEARQRAMKQAEEKAAAIIDKPSVLFEKHVVTLKNALKRSTAPDGSITVNYTGVDDYTKKATGMEDGDAITYRTDGSFIINKADGTTRPGLLDNLAQGYISAVKSMSGEEMDGQMAAKFQTDAETGFTRRLNTNSLAEYWNNFDKKPIQQKKSFKVIHPTTKKVVLTVTSQEEASKASSKGYIIE